MDFVILEFLYNTYLVGPIPTSCLFFSFSSFSGQQSNRNGRGTRFILQCRLDHTILDRKRNVVQFTDTVIKIQIIPVAFSAAGPSNKYNEPTPMVKRGRNTQKHHIFSRAEARSYTVSTLQLPLSSIPRLFMNIPCFIQVHIPCAAPDFYHAHGTLARSRYGIAFHDVPRIRGSRSYKQGLS